MDKGKTASKPKPTSPAKSPTGEWSAVLAHGSTAKLSLVIDGTAEQIGQVIAFCEQHGIGAAPTVIQIGKTK